jgi:putative ABC transport system substrate-binding protein
MTARKFTLHRSWARQATIGFLGATTPKVWSPFVAAFDNRLRALGWIDGSNLAINCGWAEGREDRYPGLANDFAGSDVDVIVTSGTPAVLAAKKQTKTIPIVFASAGDPVRTKLAASLKRPGGNVTGLSNGQPNLAGRRLDELRKVVPHLKRLAIIGNGGNGVIPLEIDQLEKRARRLKIETVVCDIRQPKQIGPAIKRLGGKVDALYVCTDPLLTTHQVAINTAAACARLPTMHAFREYVETGGLMSYGPNFSAMFGHAAELVDKILRGTNPGDIPIKLQKKCELVINQSTAHALGLTIPKSVGKRAKIIR